MIINTAPNGKIFKYAGPPGTGKSTTLLNVVDTLLGGAAAPEDIVYTTFTRAGAYEARDRAAARFKLSPDRLPYFRTLHSLCYQATGGDVMGPSDWCTIASRIGLGFTLKFSPDEGVPRGASKGDALMSLWALSRMVKRSLRDVYDHQDEWQISLPGTSFEECQHFVDAVGAYKTAFNKVDFTDMLDLYLARPEKCAFDYVIIDEAQDLSPLQWSVVQRLCESAKEVHVAGDDDQAIHEWNGASPKSFIELKASEGCYRVLDQSYRVPLRVHRKAQEIITGVKTRLEKIYKPREAPLPHGRGHVGYIGSLDGVDLTKGTWLLLARNNCFLEQYADAAERAGVYYHWSGQAGVQNIVSAILTWFKVQAGQRVTAGEAKKMYAFMSTRDRIKRGGKTQLAAQPDHNPVDKASLTADFGLVFDGPWTEALDLIKDDDREYLIATEKNEGLAAQPRILVSTIHGAKGKEADHVVLCPDMTWRTYDAFEKNPDAEHRVWYVGVTRAKQSLHILPPSGQHHYSL